MILLFGQIHSVVFGWRFFSGRKKNGIFVFGNRDPKIQNRTCKTKFFSGHVNIIFWLLFMIASFHLNVIWMRRFFFVSGTCNSTTLQLNFQYQYWPFIIPDSWILLTFFSIIFKYQNLFQSYRTAIMLCIGNNIFSQYFPFVNSGHF